MIKNIFVVGFMFFVIFFGVGNFIFLFKFGFESGEYFFLFILGFIIMGVGLFLFGIIVSVFYEGGYKVVLNCIYFWFLLIFLVVIYFFIGLFFVGFCIGVIVYEMVVVLFLGEDVGNLLLFIFMFFYFVIIMWLSFNLLKMVDCVGVILMLVLILIIIFLVVCVFFLFD